MSDDAKAVDATISTLETAIKGATDAEAKKKLQEALDAAKKLKLDVAKKKLAETKPQFLKIAQMMCVALEKLGKKAPKGISDVLSAYMKLFGKALEAAMAPFKIEYNKKRAAGFGPPRPGATPDPEEDAWTGEPEMGIWLEANYQVKKLSGK